MADEISGLFGRPATVNLGADVFGSNPTVGSSLGGQESAFGGLGGSGGMGGSTGGGFGGNEDKDRGGDKNTVGSTNPAQPGTTTPKPTTPTPGYPGVNPVAPGGLGIDNNWNNLQKRSFLASQNIAGANPAYKAPTAINYYQQLLQQGATSPTGGLNTPEQTNILDIEKQLMEQLLNKPNLNYSDIAGVLNALKAYTAQYQ